MSSTVLFASLFLTGPPGQMEFVDWLNLPEQALLVVKRLVEALEKEGIRKNSVAARFHCCCCLTFHILNC